MKIPMDLIMPDPQTVAEAEEEISTVPYLLVGIVAIAAVILIARAIRGRK